MMKNDETKYTYFRIEFEDCGNDYDYTIVSDTKEVLEYIDINAGELDDRERSAKIIITGVAMTRKEYNDWIKENLEP
jgi:hypothetical protein